MRSKQQLWSGLIFLAVIMTGILVIFPQPALAGPAGQIPTGAIPTVTGTPAIASVTVLMEQEQINVRSGPSSYDYPVIGVLVAGQTVPAIGRTVGGDWVEISYPGVPGGVAWVWSALVKVNGTLPLVESPPTPTPRTTPTIDPTLASQFIVEIPATRLPTFTPPPALVLPTYAAAATTTGTGRLPMGFVIIGLGVVGLFGTFISFLSRR